MGSMDQTNFVWSLFVLDILQKYEEGECNELYCARGWDVDELSNPEDDIYELLALKVKEYGWSSLRVIAMSYLGSKARGVQGLWWRGNW